MARPATNKTQSKLDTWLWHWLSPLGVMAKRGRDTSLHHSILKANCNKNKLKKICSCISMLVTKCMASATGHTSSSENDVATRCICCRNSSSFKAQRALAATYLALAAMTAAHFAAPCGVLMHLLVFPLPSLHSLFP